MKRSVLFVANPASYFINNFIGDSLRFIGESPAGFFSKDFATTAKAMFAEGKLTAQERNDVLWMEFPAEVIEGYEKAYRLWGKRLCR